MIILCDVCRCCRVEWLGRANGAADRPQEDEPDLNAEYDRRPPVP